MNENKKGTRTNKQIPNRGKEDKEDEEEDEEAKDKRMTREHQGAASRVFKREIQHRYSRPDKEIFNGLPTRPNLLRHH